MIKYIIKSFIFIFHQYLLNYELILNGFFLKDLDIFKFSIRLFIIILIFLFHFRSNLISIICFLLFCIFKRLFFINLKILIFLLSALYLYFSAPIFLKTFFQFIICLFTIFLLIKSSQS